MTAFLVWMLGYPLVSMAVVLCEELLLGRDYSKGVRGFVGLIETILWLGIGVLLWRRTG
jgi:hypothetical protein